MRPAAAALPLALAGLAAVAACGTGTVKVAYRPVPGDRATFKVDVSVRAVTRIGQQPARRTSDHEVFTATHEVLGTGDDGSQVRVRLMAPGADPRTYVVRIDRAAQLAEVQLVEGLPASVLGDLGLSEIFPAAAAAPPRRPIHPGDRWTIDDSVSLGGPGRSQLTGAGRLVSLGILHGHKVATLETHYRLPVDRTTGTSRLVGTQSTVATATRRLSDGTIEEEKADTTATYAVSVAPPPGTDGPTIPGTLEVEIHSTTHRL